MCPVDFKVRPSVYMRSWEREIHLTFAMTHGNSEMRHCHCHSRSWHQTTGTHFACLKIPLHHIYISEPFSSFVFPCANARQSLHWISFHVRHKDTKWRWNKCIYTRFMSYVFRILWRTLYKNIAVGLRRTFHVFSKCYMFCSLIWIMNKVTSVLMGSAASCQLRWEALVGVYSGTTQVYIYLHVGTCTCWYSSLCSTPAYPSWVWELCLELTNIRASKWTIFNTDKCLY